MTKAPYTDYQNTKRSISNMKVWQKDLTEIYQHIQTLEGNSLHQIKLKRIIRELNEETELYQKRIK